MGPYEEELSSFEQQKSGMLALDEKTTSVRVE